MKLVEIGDGEAVGKARRVARQQRPQLACVMSPPVPIHRKPVLFLETGVPGDGFLAADRGRQVESDGAGIDPHGIAAGETVRPWRVAAPCRSGCEREDERHAARARDLDRRLRRQQRGPEPRKNIGDLGVVDEHARRRPGARLRRPAPRRDRLIMRQHLQPAGLDHPLCAAKTFARIATLPMPQATRWPAASIIGFTTSGNEQLTSRASVPSRAMATATRVLSTAWNTAVALNPPSATSRLQASPVAAMTDEVWTDAACTTTLGRSVARTASTWSASRRSHVCATKAAGRAKITARAADAVASHASRSRFRPAITTRTGCAAVAAMSKTIRAANAPVPNTTIVCGLMTLRIGPTRILDTPDAPHRLRR